MTVTGFVILALLAAGDTAEREDRRPTGGTVHGPCADGDGRPAANRMRIS